MSGARLAKFSTNYRSQGHAPSPFLTGQRDDPSNGSRKLDSLPDCDTPPAEKFDFLSINYLNSFFGIASTRSLLASAGMLTDGCVLPSFVTRNDFWQLCLSNINLHGDEGHGCTRHPLPKSTWTMIFAAVNQMETLGEGLRRFAELVPIAPSGVAVTLGYGHRGVHLNFGCAYVPTDMERFERYLELIALVFHCVLLWVTNRPIDPLQVRLSSQLRDEDGSMLAGLAVERIRQGAGVTIVYSTEDMTLPLGMRKYQYWSNETHAFNELSSTWTLEGGHGASPIVEKVSSMVALRGLALKQIAPAMGMSTATLQRRLREAGTSFREISKRTRCEKMMSLLATDIDLDDVAEELGLSERRSLWRTCHEWLGVSPSEYRRAHRLGANEMLASSR